MKTQVSFNVSDDIKRNQAVVIKKEAQILCERATIFYFSALCIFSSSQAPVGLQATQEDSAPFLLNE